ncbi:hypothetical protein FNF27_07970 [Cafeteria roenbergensis]|uniref:Nuclear pore localisation protein NPL4 C-terminal domain-containing protein n=1 Tax=Cafeteria roenbergensis TaxID=33653 RepID=A0A5A8DEZ5_CAFRO|nr:hypothetical protein FNF31_07000 [Cafeteria roenbergensis]KAA0163194.1 hypothetical protein FNF27_07970 [Cafeteria roenbergensis]
MPVVRCKHRRGKVDRVTVNFEEDRVSDVLERLHKALGLECGVDAMLACVNNDKLHEGPRAAVNAEEDVSTAQDATLESLGLRNGSFVYVSYPIPEDEVAAAAAAGASGTGAADGGFVIESRTTPASSSSSSAAAAAARGGGPMINSLRAMRDDAERRKVVQFVVESGALGNATRSKAELPETATVGDIRGIAAKQLGIPADRVGLAHGRAEAGSVTAERQFGSDSARLTEDPNGPRMEGAGRISAVIFAFDKDPPAPADAVGGAGGAGGAGGVAAAGAGGAGAGGAGAGGAGAGAGAGGSALSWGGPAPTSQSSSSAAAAAAASGGGGGGGAAAAAAGVAAAAAAGDGEVDVSSLPEDLRPPPGQVSDSASLRRYLKQHAEFITFQGIATHRQLRINMNPFLNQRLQTRRVAWLFGTVADAEAGTYAAQGAGKTVSVEAIYEPPQLGFKHRVLLPSDPHQPCVSLVAASLGLVPVGWLITAPFRGDPQNVLTSSEILTAAALQAEHPHFMTVVFTFEQQDDPALGRTRIFRTTTAWQLSDQAVKLYRKGQLCRSEGDDPYLIRTKKTVMASDPDDPTHRVRATKRFHASYLVAPAGIQALGEDDTLLSSRFPAANRRSASGDEIPVTVEMARKAVFGMSPVRGETAAAGGAFATGRSIRETMLARVADFNFLVWLCREGPSLSPYPVSQMEVAELCHAVQSHDGDAAAGFRFKLMAALGAGWLCPLTEATRGYDDVRESPEDLRDHIARTFGDDPTPVVDPLRAVEVTTRAEREEVYPRLLSRLRAKLGREDSDSEW